MHSDMTIKCCDITDYQIQSITFASIQHIQPVYEIKNDYQSNAFTSIYDVHAQITFMHHVQTRTNIILLALIFSNGVADLESSESDPLTLVLKQHGPLALHLLWSSIAHCNTHAGQFYQIISIAACLCNLAPLQNSDFSVCFSPV